MIHLRYYFPELRYRDILDRLLNKLQYSAVRHGIMDFPKTATEIKQNIYYQTLTHKKW